MSDSPYKLDWSGTCASSCNRKYGIQFSHSREGDRITLTLREVDWDDDAGEYVLVAKKASK